jgi:putative phosphoribosyl transferase
MRMTSERAVRVGVGEVQLDGDLTMPDAPAGLVIFAHGSGSSRHSPRNKQVAAALQQRGLATLLMDLLTHDEEQVDLRTRELRFDIDLLAERVAGAVDWAGEEPGIEDLCVGLFGASTGAAAALMAAAERPAVAAVVSRGGRPDLAGEALSEVEAPTLLIVGGEDHLVIDLNEQARDRLRADVELVLVPGAGHLFEEPGALDQVCALAGGWFARHLGNG